MASSAIRRMSDYDHDELDGIDTRYDEDEISNEEINIIVAQLKRITRCANLEFSLRIGAVIIHHFYNGDTSGWRSRRAKSASFRRLAQHPELPLSAGALYRCVALFELCERLKAPSRWEHLGASHLRMVLGLPPDIQERVLAAANENRWTVKRLQQAIVREKATRVTQGGRRCQPPLSKSLRTVRKCLADHMNVFESVDISNLNEVDECAQLLEETRLCLENLAQMLRSTLHGCNDASRSTAASS